MNLELLADEEFCYLTTKGRRTGEPHEIEIWFALVAEKRVLYMMAGERYDYDWVKNLTENPGVSIRIGDETLKCEASVIEGEEDEPLARGLLVGKYERETGELEKWGKESLPVAFYL